MVTNSKKKGLNEAQAEDKFEALSAEITKAQKPLFSSVDKCIGLVSAHVESTKKLEGIVSTAALECLQHAQKHGDVMPADRLLKGLKSIDHRFAKTLAGEVMVYYTTMSPIRWNAKGEPRQAKPADSDYRPYDLETAEKTPFFDMEAVKKARIAADKAHGRGLSPLTAEGILNAIRGQIKRIEAVAKGEADTNGQVRKFARGQKAAVLELKGELETFLKALDGEDKDKEEGQEAA